MSISMSKGKLRNVQECADCGSSDPTWASVNRGILLCDECCSIHRSLGRHVSQVKSLKKGSWSPTLLQMVHTLNNHGVNSVWEHSLLDPMHSKSGRRKPQCRDPLHPTKADFIRAKHQMLAFVFRPGKDDTLLLEDDLSRQLHSSVRTSNLETSLRLLSQGADPNYFHEEKGTTPLHIAAKAGQVSQAELLVVYGADPGAEDSKGKTPIDYARLSGHKDLGDRLVECMYELTDRLAYYLCSRRPDHQIGQHYIVPELSDTVDLTEFTKAAKKKLQLLPNHLFEELAMDVYDEVDRRETESIWLSTLKSSTLLAPERCTVPFLPLNPEFSSTRNQGRQKLARFNAREFATLIIDILSDAKRRQSPVSPAVAVSQEIKGPQLNKVPGNPLPINVDVHQPGRKSEVSDDEPLYDSVASDEDYVAAEQIAILSQQAANMKLQESKSSTLERVEETAAPEKEESTSVSTEKGNGPPRAKSELPISECNSNKLHSLQNGGMSSVDENIKRELAASQNEMGDLRSEIQILQSTVQNLVRENSELRSIIQHAGLSLPHLSFSSLFASPLPNGHEAETEPVVDGRSSRSLQRPASMYEPREGLLRSGSQSPHIHHCMSATAHTGKWDKNQKRELGVNEHDSTSTVARPVMTQSLYHCPSPNRDGLTSTSSILPPAEEVIRRTDQVTKRIQELWVSMQEGRDTFAPCAEKIRAAVTELIAIFPQNPWDETIRSALHQMNSHTLRLQSECAGLQRCAGDSAQFSEQAYLQQVRLCAYHIAKATKQLVTKFQY